MVKKYKYLMAKSDSQNNDLWLPLWMHLRDTAGVIKKLIHRWVPMSVINASGLAFDEFEKTAVFIAAVHDIGKATSCFQNVITINYPNKKNEIEYAGFIIAQSPASVGKMPHSYAGQWILQSTATRFEIDKSIADVIGAHHGKPIDGSNNNLMKSYEANFYGAENDERAYRIWEEAWGDIVSDALIMAGKTSENKLPYLSMQAQVLITGLLITADWIASNTSYFPLITTDDFGSEDLYPERINKGFEKISFPEVWHSEYFRYDDKIFKERFGFMPNSVQEAIIEAVGACRTPGIFIIEAQMGSGKTEAALAAAELLASKTEAGGVFWGLPTQATSNGLFKRLYDWAESVSEDTANAIRLAHGAAVLNDDYEELLERGRSIIDEDDSNGLSVHPWFQGNKKALLADFVIGTVDQFLMASLRRKHFMLRHLGLAGKIVIIDECHAYDAYMNKYLDRAIEWMASYGVPVVLLSATLPPKRRRELIKCYAAAYSKYYLRKKRPEIFAENDDWKNSIQYPLLTWTDGEKVCQQQVKQDAPAKEVSIEKAQNISEIILLLNDALADGGCACVILNTVRKAQEVYEIVTANIHDVTVILYHAQFIMSDRAAKEQQLLKHMGKYSNSTLRYRYILIGTQVLEQSLDYDADIMVTQLCPADLLLQRIGRLHRHNRQRPERLSTPRCIILCNDKEPFDLGTEAVYGEYLLRKTWTEFEGKDKLLLPNEISQIVYDVYETEAGDDLLEAWNEYEKQIESKEERAKGYRLKKPIGLIEGILENEDEMFESAAESRVRDGDSALEVLLMQEKEDGYAVCMGSVGEKFRLNLEAIPTKEDAKFIARQRLRLPQVFSQPWNVSKAIEELEIINKSKLARWQESPLIKGELVLLLDKDGRTELCGYQLSYCNEVGLKYIKKEKTDAGKRI